MPQYRSSRFSCLTGSVNGRYFRTVGDRPLFLRFFTKGLWVAPLVAEAAALIVLAQGADSLVLRGLMPSGILLAGAIITTYAIYGPAATDANDDHL